MDIDARLYTSPAGRTETPGNPDPDSDKGAIEGDRPDQRQQGNRNVPALDRDGLPADWTRICEDVIGANEDGSQG